MNRTELDAHVAQHGLDRPEVEELLDSTGARPSPEELSFLIGRGLQIAGALSVAAGFIFFIAANWGDFRVFSRFALIEGAFLACIGLALFRPPPVRSGQLAVLGAFLLVGVLLALFGQTYQTGASEYELFHSWTLLGLPFVIAARWSVVTGAWILVLNVFLATFCAWQITTGRVSYSDSVGYGLLYALAMLVDVALWATAEFVSRVRAEGALASMAPRWVRRLLVALIIVCGTWSGSWVVLRKWTGDGYSFGYDSLTIALILGSFAAIGAHTLRRRADIFPLAMLAGSVIYFVCLYVGPFGGLAGVFLATLWLIGSSTFVGHWLIGLSRTWKPASVES